MWKWDSTENYLIKMRYILIVLDFLVEGICDIVWFYEVEIVTMENKKLSRYPNIRNSVANKVYMINMSILFTIELSLTASWSNCPTNLIHNFN